MQKWPKMTFLPKKWPKIIFSKNAAQCLQNTLQGMSGPNFSSKASVAFSNSAGRREKMKFLDTAKTQNQTDFLRKQYLYGAILILCLKYYVMNPITIGMLFKSFYLFRMSNIKDSKFKSLKMEQNLLKFAWKNLYMLF